MHVQAAVLAETAAVRGLVAAWGDQSHWAYMHRLACRALMLEARWRWGTEAGWDLPSWTDHLQGIDHGLRGDLGRQMFLQVTVPVKTGAGFALVAALGGQSR